MLAHHVRVLVVAVLTLAINIEASFALTIDCTFRDFYYQGVGNIYHCRAAVVFDDNVRDEITAVRGAHKNGNTNYDVEGLYIFNKSIDIFPTKIQDFFPNIKALHFPGNLISNISNKNLIPFPNLQYLDLHGNKISSLDSDLFSGLDSLKLIRLSHNNIKHIGRDIILPKNCAIILFRNPCVHEYASTEDEIKCLKSTLQKQCPPAAV
ncbi:Leucine-rich repeat-containing protein 15 [Pseudolycoriella hygida]|uniref:Leucine-rich repeat-containing protein 15 n=1 Tax=Pseudolycoriella hygida TaxID=35572 RepID=A0A9Q0RXW7_9DIPT|nr:Leucine-rich repeat-containing protein 15 [Pseudolycoriella hygida]